MIKGEKWTRLVTLVKEIDQKKILDNGDLTCQLEFNLLEETIVHTNPNMSSRTVKLNTTAKLLQEKYNLLREETEGYAKLVTVLSTIPAQPIAPTAHIQNVLSIMGSFDLDPNRTLDVILDIFEEQTWNLSFLKILQLFKRSHIAHTIGFKFLFYHKQPLPLPLDTPTLSSTSKTLVPTNAQPILKPGTTLSTSTKGTSKEPVASTKVSQNLKTEPNIAAVSGHSEIDIDTSMIPYKLAGTPKSLYLVAALLLANEYISLKEILPYFDPQIKCTVENLLLKDEEIEKKIKNYGVVSLAAKSNEKEKEKEKGATATTVCIIIYLYLP